MKWKYENSGRPGVLQCLGRSGFLAGDFSYFQSTYRAVQRRGLPTQDVSRVGLLLAGERSVAHLGGEAPEGVADDPVEIRVAPHEARSEVGSESQQVRRDQHLTVRARTRADPDRRNLEGGAHLGG